MLETVFGHRYAYDYHQDRGFTMIIDDAIHALQKAKYKAMAEYDRLSSDAPTAVFSAGKIAGFRDAIEIIESMKGKGAE